LIHEKSLPQVSQKRALGCFALSPGIQLRHWLPLFYNLPNGS
jgi:hypothetical protein